jgi:hypothetical protein
VNLELQVKNVKRIRLLALCMMLITSSLLIGCEFSRNLSDTKSRVALLKAQLNETLGGSSEIGWRAQADHITEITVYLDPFLHEDMSVADLKEKVREAVEENVNPVPDRIIISLRITNLPSGKVVHRD